ncbi:preprotein translocase subunit TatC, partial [Escherichia coli]|nr:preprotein translocase subunit TatC [Escherichia coli]
ELAGLFLGRAMRVAHSFRLSIAFNRGADTVGLQPFAEADLV